MVRLYYFILNLSNVFKFFLTLFNNKIFYSNRLEVGGYWLTVVGFQFLGYWFLVVSNDFFYYSPLRITIYYHSLFNLHHSLYISMKPAYNIIHSQKCYYYTDKTYYYNEVRSFSSPSAYKSGMEVNCIKKPCYK